MHLQLKLHLYVHWKERKKNKDDKKSNRERRKNSDDSDSSASSESSEDSEDSSAASKSEASETTDSSDDEKKKKDKGKKDKAKKDKAKKDKAKKDKDKSDDEDNDDHEEEKDKGSSSDESDGSDAKEEELNSRSKQKQGPSDEDLISQDYVVMQNDEGDVMQDKDGDKQKIEWTKYAVLGAERFPKNQCSWILTELKQNSLYYVRLRAQNTSGWGLYSYPLTEIKTENRQIDSKILKEKEQNLLLSYLSRSQRKKKWRLLFRGSRDGFDAATFHRKCDNKGATITIVHSNLGHVFGGYTSLPWTSHTGTYCNDNDSFIFLLRSKRGQKGKYTIKNNAYSVYHQAGYGPTFGGGFDFYLCSNCNTTNSSYSNAGHSYSCNSDQTLLAGAYNFTVQDYEVYQLK